MLGAVAGRLGRHALATGHHLASFEERGDKVVARFVDPAGQPAGEAEGDLLIGADGIHSAVRKHFYPGEAAVFDGYLHYRGTVAGDPYLTGRSMVVVGHRTHRAIIYPIVALPDGKVMINWLAYTKIPSGSPPLEAWDTAADKSLAVDRFEGWTYPWLDVQGLIARTQRVLQLPNVDRDPIPRWSFSRVTLIGDAAHPMQPVGAQAGSQAVVDGRVLAAALLETGDPVEALVRYQDRRIAAMNDMIIRNRNLGLETVLQMAEERAPNGFAKISDVLSQERAGIDRIELQEGGGFRSRDRQQPAVLCRAAAVGGIGAEPIRAHGRSDAHYADIGITALMPSSGLCRMIVEALFYGARDRIMSPPKIGRLGASRIAAFGANRG